MTSYNNKRSNSTPDSDSGSIGIYLLIVFIGFGLLMMMPSQVQWVDTTKGWYLQPRFASGVGLSVFIFFALIQVFNLRHQLSLSNLNPLERLVDFLSSYRTALMSSLLFLLYLVTLPIAGFFLSTCLFVITLLWLSRLLNPFWLMVTLCSAVVLVLIFRVGVNLWLPDVWLYEHLPDSWADFANQYL